jgi:2-polyprenyl-6-methoxyphenol hydroxylase-like FAD-dependent oxidoreductase
VPDGFATDVLICGAGAAGLTLAIDLARRGVAFRLIDMAEGPFQGSRGKGLQPRSLELFEDLGILRPDLCQGWVLPAQTAVQRRRIPGLRNDRAQGAHSR